MNVLITAGATAERIDSVRSITNDATGRLGSLTAECFAKSGRAERIFYLCGKTARRPETARAEITVIEDTADMERAARALLGNTRIDAIVHSMAVSDYRVRSVVTPALLADSLAAALASGGAGEIRERCGAALEEAASVQRDKKISSAEKHLILILESTPKIISLFHELAPRALLVGFKLLDRVSREELFEAARGLLEKNHCAFVLANDAGDIHGDTHSAYLIDRNKKARRCGTKQEIAAAITDRVIAAFYENKE
ncbi:MAG: phosphopantothenoylcysteine synthase [Spirochaetales bacterium]|nr:phosphopantothenoylcysteine synthase [Spirochaetales bacterium]